MILNEGKLKHPIKTNKEKEKKKPANVHEFF
jgi:hypothetical protein